MITILDLDWKTHGLLTTRRGNLYGPRKGQARAGLVTGEVANGSGVTAANRGAATAQGIGPAVTASTGQVAPEDTVAHLDDRAEEQGELDREE